MVGYIYRTTNKINGKKYIGRHEATEFEPNKYIGSGTILLKAIDKYGKENFECELIESCETVQELAEREKYWINFYDATHDPNYYNLSEGGSGACGEVFSKIVKECWKDPEYRRKHVEGSIRKWKDEQYKQKHHDGSAKNAHIWTQKEKELQSKKEKQSWSDVELRNRHSILMKSLWDDNKKEIQRIKNIGANNPCYGRKYMTDGNNNWIYIQPEKAPPGFQVKPYTFITNGISKLRHDKSLPLPDGWYRYRPSNKLKVSDED